MSIWVFDMFNSNKDTLSLCNLCCPKVRRIIVLYFAYCFELLWFHIKAFASFLILVFSNLYFCLVFAPEINYHYDFLFDFGLTIPWNFQMSVFKDIVWHFHCLQWPIKPSSLRDTVSLEWSREINQMGNLKIKHSIIYMKSFLCHNVISDT